MNPKDWPAMPDEITRDGPYRVYKGGRYAVYDDGNSAETPYQTDRANALEARLRDTAAALQELVNRQGQSHDDYCSFMQASAYRRNRHGNPYCDCKTSALLNDARALLAQLRTEGLTP